MKKISVLLILFLTVFAFAGIKKTWRGPTTMGAGATALQTGVTGKRIILKNILFTVANACNLYFYSGTAPTGTAISNTFYLSANSGISSLDWDNLDFITASGAGLGVWTSADPGSNLLYETEVVDS